MAMDSYARRLLLALAAVFALTSAAFAADRPNVILIMADDLGNPIRRPHFVPVCINGELMAALVNAPRVIIEDYE